MLAHGALELKPADAIPRHGSGTHRVGDSGVFGDVDDLQPANPSRLNEFAKRGQDGRAVWTARRDQQEGVRCGIHDFSVVVLGKRTGQN